MFENNASFIGLALNNIFIMGLHTNAATTAINTLGYTICSVWWGFIVSAVMFAGSLFRDFHHAEAAALVSAGTMFFCFLTVVIGHGVQDHPNGWISDEATPISWTVWAPEGTTFAQGVSALLNIAYTFSGQALVPSFVGDMKYPEQFPTALYITVGCQLTLFTICGAVVFSYAGTQFTVAPAYGSLLEKWRYAGAALVLPTIVSPCLGIKDLSH